MLGRHGSQILSPARNVRLSVARGPIEKLFIREMDFAEIISASFRIYFKNILSLFKVGFLPLVPLILILRTMQGSSESFVLSLICEIIIIVCALIVAGALSLAVSDIYLGRKPGFRAVYGRMRYRIGGYIGTYLLMLVIIALGFVLLVVPGFAAIVLTMFVPAVTVIERHTGIRAIRRSIALGKGSYLRNGGILLGIMITVWLFFFMFGFVSGFTVGMFMNAEAINEVWFQVTVEIFVVAVNQIASIGIVLLYYDMRVRKESFDVNILAVDLDH